MACPPKPGYLVPCFSGSKSRFKGLGSGDVIECGPTLSLDPMMSFMLYLNLSLVNPGFPLQESRTDQINNGDSAWRSCDLMMMMTVDRWWSFRTGQQHHVMCLCARERVRLRYIMRLWKLGLIPWKRRITYRLTTVECFHTHNEWQMKHLEQEIENTC